MSSMDFVFQGWTEGTHRNALSLLLGTPQLEKFYGSVAFARVDGVDELKDQFTAVGRRGRIFVGVRNEITSKQALESLLSTGMEIYAVDTAKRSVLFHPKAYLAICAQSARVLLGSANLTHSGLFNNVEFGAFLDFDLAIAAEARKVRSFQSLLDGLIARFPRHVIRVTPATIADLFDSGRLEDEAVRVVVPPRSKVRAGNRDDLPPIETPFVPPPARARRRQARRQQRAVGVGAPPPPTAPALQAVALPLSEDFELVWRSKGLKRRDLNIPDGANTSATGSMFWKKGDLDDIDQRHFFRDDVFADLPWAFDPTPSRAHYERVNAQFRLVVKGLDLGIFTLKMSHNTATDTAAYDQNNSMTQLHWGPAKPHVAKLDLLGRIMSLYRRRGSNGQPEFLIEID